MLAAQQQPFVLLSLDDVSVINFPKLTINTFTQKDNETLQNSGVQDNAVIDCSVTKFGDLRARATDIPQINTTNVRLG